MKLFTHNFLTSRFLKNVQTGYPLKLVVEKAEEIKTEFNNEFMQKLLNKIDYQVLRETALVCGHSLPPDAKTANEDGLQAIHTALFDVEIITGTLICPETGRKFPISDGIPNMLCNEDE